MTDETFRTIIVALIGVLTTVLSIRLTQQPGSHTSSESTVGKAIDQDIQSRLTAPIAASAAQDAHGLPVPSSDAVALALKVAAGSADVNTQLVKALLEDIPNLLARFEAFEQRQNTFEQQWNDFRKKQTGEVSVVVPAAMTQ